MITPEELKKAIEVTQGERNPTAYTCFKLAAFYICLRECERKNEPAVAGVSAPIEVVAEYQSRSLFGQAVRGKAATDILDVIDEFATSVLQFSQPDLYTDLLQKLYTI